MQASLLQSLRYGYYEGCKVNGRIKQNRVRLLSQLRTVPLLGDILEMWKSIPSTLEAIAKVKTCSPDDKVNTVWGLMLETDYTGIPVISKKGEPIK